MRCDAHILNLVVKDGLTDLDISIVKTRTFVKYVRSSPTRLQKFKSSIEEEKLDSKSLVCLNIETRWNSTYLMLESTLKFRKAFANLILKDSTLRKEMKKVGGDLSVEEWKQVSTFFPFLKVIYDATLKLLVFLDPRRKMVYVDWMVKAWFGIEKAKSLSFGIKSTFCSLFDFYASSMPAAKNLAKSNSPGSTAASNFQIKNKENEKMFDFSEFLGNTFEMEACGGIIEKKVEWEKYLEDERESNELCPNVLQWWKENKHRYRTLAKLDRDILPIPVSTFALESAFSTGGHVLDSFRTSLTPRMVEALICAQDWLRTAKQPFIIEESLLGLEKWEEGMENFTIEQPGDEEEEETKELVSQVLDEIGININSEPVINKMNKISYELNFEDIFRESGFGEGVVDGDHEDVKFHHRMNRDVFSDSSDAGGLFRVDELSDLPSFPFPNQEIMNGFSSCAEVTGALLWCQSYSTPKHSCVTATMDSQSSICAGSPTLDANYLPKSCDYQAVGVTSGSSHELSDDDDIDTEAGPCEQSDQVDVKCIKR
ncbi:hypothetical protein AgCh_025301 [Apium graveolens]